MLRDSALPLFTSPADKGMFPTGQPTERWSNDDKSLRAKGGWVTRLATSTCADVYSEHEEYLVEMAPKLCTVDMEKGKKTCRLLSQSTGV